jgi:hypothetical protein
MAGVRKKTLRKMSPVTRKLARLQGEVASVNRRLKNMLPLIQEMEKRQLELDAEIETVTDRMKGN